MHRMLFLAKLKGKDKKPLLDSYALVVVMDDKQWNKETTFAQC